MNRRSIKVIGAAGALVACLAGAPAAVAVPLTGRIGPSNGLTNYGHQLHPAGRMTTLGDFPTGAALTPDGRFAWVVDAGHGRDDARIVSIRTGRTVQVLPLPGAYVGVAVSPDGTRAYVSGEPKGDSKPAGPTKGNDGDVIHVFAVDRRSGRAAELEPITIPHVTGGTAQQHASSPIPGISTPGPSAGSALDWPQGLALSRDGATLAVALNQADALALIDTATRAVRTVKVGTYPYGAAISPDGRTAYVSDEYAGTISVVDVPTATLRASIPVGGDLGATGSHPEGLVLDRSGQKLYVAVASRDQIAVVDTASGSVGYVSLAHGPALGTEPIALALSPDGRWLYSADAGEDAVAMISLGAAGGPRIVGRIPTASYPSSVGVTPDGRKLVWVSAWGLGAGPNPDYGTFFADSDKAPYGTYVPDMLLGRLGVLRMPGRRSLRKLTGQAGAQSIPSNLIAPPAGTPLGLGGPIKHVFVVIKENRTYDQLFGTDPRGDGDPKLELFDDNGVATKAAGVTPNAHALTRRFPLLDHFYADSEVSVDGHIIDSGGYAIDFVKKALHPNYSGRGRVDEFGTYAVTLPPRDFVFDQAVRQGISFRNFGELAAGVLPGANDGRPTYQGVLTGTQLAYPFLFGCDGLPLPITPADQGVACDTDSGTVGLGGLTNVTHSRINYFQSQFRLQLAIGSVPALTWLTLPNDHTNGVRANYPTPRALVADNDLALGQLVDLISHSPIWSSSAILVEEDDSQDGADHVDAHRMPAYVISPWAAPGAVVHERYDQESMLRTAELLVGIKPLSRFDAYATPMYGAFRNDGRPDLRPYDAITPTQPTRELTTAAQARAAGPLAAALPFDHPDVVPQALSDRVLWQSVYGPASTPPVPGPGASALEAARARGALAVLRAGGDVRAWLLRRTDDLLGRTLAQAARLTRH